jgi:ParB family chromosome partitioning protein
MAKKPIGSIALTGFEDLFNVGVQDGAERITEIALTELFPPDFHPFNVTNDEAMQNLAESIRLYGVREPGLARKRGEDEGGYELLSGNRRKMACEIAGLETMPVIVRVMNDDDAAIAMVDANLQQREKLMYSEKAWAYRVKLEALDHNGIKGEHHSYEIIRAQTGDSKNQIFRFLRLTELVPDLLDKVDNRKISFNAGVELSHLTRQEQAIVVDCMAKYDCKPSLSQAVRLKKLEQAGTLTIELIDSMLAEDKKPPKGEERGSARFRRYFPPDYSMKQIENVIIGLIKDWTAANAPTLPLTAD